MDKKDRMVKCEGRFASLRDFLYNEAFPVVLRDRTLVTEADLQDAWDLAGDDFYLADVKQAHRDPYFNSKTDVLRKNPSLDALSLVPLLEAPLVPGSGLITSYALSIVNTPFNIADKLEEFAKHHGRYLETVFEREPRNIVFPSGDNLSGYRISVNFGIGTISSGGVSGSGIRSDSPFIIEVYKEDTEREGKGSNLVAVVGFWTQGKDMLVSQIQSCRNAKFPQRVPFGVGCLHVAECIARNIGYERVVSYSARNHPIFHEHPDDWGKLEADFKMIWDNSAKKLHFKGCPTGNYYKLVGNNTKSTCR